MFHREAIMSPFCLSIKYTISNSGKVNFVLKAMLWSIKLEVVSPIPRWVSPYLVLGQQILCPWKVRGVEGGSYCLARLAIFQRDHLTLRLISSLAWVLPSLESTDWRGTARSQCYNSLLPRFSGPLESYMNLNISLQLDLYIFNAINDKTSDLMSIFHSQNERKLFTFSNRSSIIRT